MHPSRSVRRARRSRRPLLMERLEERVNPGFVAPPAYETGEYTRSVAAADFDRDGSLDLAVAHGIDRHISVLLGDGSGNFRLAHNLIREGGTAFVAVADVNGDSFLDIAAAGVPNLVSVFLGNGDGSFQAARSFPVASLPYSVAVGDVNEDGPLDLVTAHYSDGSVSVLLGNGDGSFQTARNVSVGGRPTFAVLGDLNGDGKLDLAVTIPDNTDRENNRVGILLGVGDGTFQQPRNYSVGVWWPQSVVIGDFNGDGTPDLATSNRLESVHTVSVLLGNGDGTFQNARHAISFASPYHIATGDLNGDGWLDLVTANVFVKYATYAMSILLGNGDGTFQDARTLWPGALSPFVALADLNSDGALDLAAVLGPNNTVNVLLGNGDGSFQNPENITKSTGLVRAVVAGDLNGDGFPDLASFDSTRVRVQLGNGDGSFQTGQEYIAGDGVRSAVVGDLNGDGFLDLAAAIFGPNTVSVLLGNGDGTFRGPRHSDSGGPTITLAIGDLNGDGILDMVAGTTPTGTIRVYVLLGNGDGTYQSPRHINNTAVSPDSMVLADFNGDGFLDLASIRRGPGRGTVALGNGDGSFRPELSFATAFGPVALAAGDFDGDGILDLAVTYQVPTGVVSILLGNGNATFQEPRNTRAGANPGAMVVGDVNQDGLLDLVVASDTLRVLLGNGDRTFLTSFVSYHMTSYGGYYLNSVLSHLAMGDFNGDGLPDVVVGSRGVFLLPNDGVWSGPQPAPGDGGNSVVPDLFAVDDLGGGKRSVLTGTWATMENPGTFGSTRSTRVPAAK